MRVGASFISVGSGTRLSFAIGSAGGSAAEPDPRRLVMTCLVFSSGCGRRLSPICLVLDVLSDNSGVML